MLLTTRILEIVLNFFTYSYLAKVSKIVATSYFLDLISMILLMWTMMTSCGMEK